MFYANSYVGKQRERQTTWYNTTNLVVCSSAAHMVALGAARRELAAQNRKLPCRHRYRADLVVREPDGAIELIVEIKSRGLANVARASKHMRSAMLYVNCHSGLLITPDYAYIYRETFENPTPEAIVLTHDNQVKTKDLLGPYAAGRNLKNERDLTSAVAAGWKHCCRTGSTTCLPTAMPPKP